MCPGDLGMNVINKLLMEYAFITPATATECAHFEVPEGAALQDPVVEAVISFSNHSVDRQVVLDRLYGSGTSSSVLADCTARDDGDSEEDADDASNCRVEGGEDSDVSGSRPQDADCARDYDSGKSESESDSDDDDASNEVRWYNIFHGKSS